VIAPERWLCGAKERPSVDWQTISGRWLAGAVAALALACAGPAAAQDDLESPTTYEISTVSVESTSTTSVTSRSSTSMPIDGMLYEVTENMYLLDAAGNPVPSPAGAARRMADATLQGWAKVGTPPCPADILWIIPNATRCTITATGIDDLDIQPGSPNLWKGKVTGTYAIVVQDDNVVDAPEFVIQTGSFSGNMDLSSRPLGWVKGAFKPCAADGDCTGFPFTGRFRLPFKIDSTGRWVTPKRWDPAFYLADDGATLQWVRPVEYSLGFATVKLELRFQ
jgi:hypothetical protein